MGEEEKREFFWELDEKLTQEEKNSLIIILANISERSYRRGVQQALHFERTRPEAMTKKMSEDEIHDWRYEIPLSDSIGIDGFKTTSLERLSCEEHYLPCCWYPKEEQCTQKNA